MLWSPATTRSRRTFPAFPEWQSVAISGNPRGTRACNPRAHLSRLAREDAQQGQSVAISGKRTFPALPERTRIKLLAVWTARLNEIGSGVAGTSKVWSSSPLALPGILVTIQPYGLATTPSLEISAFSVPSASTIVSMMRTDVSLGT